VCTDLFARPKKKLSRLILIYICRYLLGYSVFYCFRKRRCENLMNILQMNSNCTIRGHKHINKVRKNTDERRLAKSYIKTNANPLICQPYLRLVCPQLPKVANINHTVYARPNMPEMSFFRHYSI